MDASIRSSEYLKNSETWCRRRTEKIVWTERVRKEVIRKVKEWKNNLQKMKK